MKDSTDIFPVDSDKQLQAVPEGTYRVYVKANIFSDEVVFANVPCEIAVWDLLGRPSNPDGFYVEVDGEGVPAELLRGVAANPGQLVDIKRVPGDDDFLRILLNLALIVASIYIPGLTSLGKFGQAVLGAVILTAGQIAINALIPFDQPDLTSSKAAAALNNIGATRNRLEPFAIIPRIFGKVRQYPPYAANPFTEVLGNDIWLNAVFCIGEGSKFDVSDIRIGTTELINMSDVALVKTTTPEYPDVFQENLNIELKQVALDPGGEEAIRATQKNTTRASVDIAFPRGLTLLNTDGSKSRWTVDFSIEFRLKGSSDVWNSVAFEDWLEQTEANSGTFGNPRHSFDDENGDIIIDWPRGGANTEFINTGFAGGIRIPVGGAGAQPRTNTVQVSLDDAANFTSSRATVDGFRLSVKWTFPSSGEWDVRVKRRGSFNPANGTRIITTNPLYTDGRIADIFLFTTLRSFNDNNVTAVDIGGDLWYMQLRIKATDQLSGALDTFNYLVEGYTRPYDGNTWLAPTKNRSPAWAFAEVLTGKSSAEPVPDVDLIADELKLWDDWATANSFTFDFEFVDEASMFDVLNRIASAGRAALSQREGKFTVITDNEQTAPVQMFTRRNSRNFKGTKVFLDTLHGVKVRWRSENEDYQWTEREVYNTVAGFDVNNATRFEVLELLGIVQDDQAFKMALRYMAEVIHRPEFYFLDTDFEHLIAQRGDTVLVQNERMLVGTASARIESIVGLVVTLDQGGFIVENAKSYVLRFRTQIGQESNPQSIAITVANVTSPTSGVDVSAFTVDAVPASAKKGDMVVFGELTSDTIRCKVVEVFPKDNLEASLSLTIEAAAIYNADSGTIPPYVPVISTIPDPANVIPPIPFITAIESSGFIGTQQAGGILILKAVVSYNIDIVGSGYGGPLFIQVAYREFDQDIDTEAGTLKYTEWVPHDQGNIIITNLADNQVYQFFIRSRSVHGTVSLFSLGKEHLVSGAPGITVEPVDLFTVASTVLGVTLNLDVTNVIQKNLQHLEIKYSTVNNRDGDGSPDPIPTTFLAPLPSDLASLTLFEIFVPLPDNVVRFFWARVVNIYDQASLYFPLSATAGLSAAAFQFPSPTQFVQLTYDDLDTTQLAANQSRYAMLTAVATDTSGSQNNFQLTDAILLNKKDKAGANHALLLAEIRNGDKIVFKVGLTRWFVFEVTDTKFEIVGTGVAEAYKFDVVLLEFSDSDPTVNIPTAAGTDVTFEIHKSNFDTAQQVVIDPDFDLSTALTGPEGSATNPDITSNPGSVNFWAWAFEQTGITQGVTNVPDTKIQVGGVNSSNSLFIKQGLYESQAPLTPPDFQSIRVWHTHRFRTTNPSFNIKIRARNLGTDRDTTLRIIMSGFDLPRGGAFIESLTQLPVLFRVPKNTTTYKEYSYHVSGADTLAQYWQFAIAIFETRGTGWQTAADLQEVEIDSIIVETTPPTFGKLAYVGSTDVVPGLVPGSDTTETGKFLRADGVWEDPPGGSAPVTSVFGRTGAIVALQADYDAFFLTPAEGDAVYPRLADAETISGNWTWTGRLVTDDSTTARAGFNIPTGVAPTTPVQGDMWVVAADAFIRINGVNESIIGAGSGGNVSNVGTPLNDQLAIWTGATTIEGVAGLTFDGTSLEATQFAGIVKANLVDLAAAETITAEWTFSVGLKLLDSDTLTFGAGNDVVMQWDATQFRVSGAAVNQNFDFIDGMTIRIFNETETNHLSIDYTSANVAIFDTSLGRIIINHAGQLALRTLDHTGSGNLSGAAVADASGNLQNIGFNELPVLAQNVSASFLRSRAGYLMHKASGVAVTFTADNDATIGANAWWWVFNEDTETVTIAQGTGVTIKHWKADGAPTTGNIILAQGDYGRLFKFSDTEYWWFGDTNAEINDLTVAVTWANVPDANITVGSVTQHEAALTILESQITNAGLLARVADAETISGNWIFSGDVTWSGVATRSITGGTLRLDNNVFLEFGAGLGNISSDGTDIIHVATGTRDIVFLLNSVENALRLNANGAVQAWFDNALKFATQAAGITVTGDVAATTHGGIAEADLVDKIAAETIAGDWTWTGRLVTDDSTTVRAGFNIPTGVAPTTPVHGDMWVTAADAFIRIGAVSESIIGGGGGAVTSVFTRTGAVVALAGDYATVAETFTALQTFSGNVAVAAATPLFSMQDTDAAADEKNWLFRVTAGDLVISTALDATPFTQGPQAISMIRGTGNVFSNFQLGGPILMAETSAAVGDIAAFGQFWVRDDPGNTPMFTDDVGSDAVLLRDTKTATISAGWTFSADPTFTGASGPLINTVEPQLRIRESDAAVGEKYWRLHAQAGLFSFDTLDDAFTTPVNIFTVARTGTVVDEFNIKAAVLKLDDNIELRFGTPAAGDAVMKSDGVDLITTMAAGADWRLLLATENAIVATANAEVMLSYNGNNELQTAQHNAVDNITGAKVRHFDGTFYDVGMAVMPRVLFTVNTTISDTHWHKRLVHNGTADVSLNLTFNTEVSQPQDVVMWVLAKNGPVVLVDGTMVLHLYDGASTPIGGNITVARGGWATIVKDTDSLAHVTGIGLTQP